MMNSVDSPLGRRLAAWALATVFISSVTACGNSTSDVVVSAVGPGTFRIAPAGTGPVLAGVDHAIVLERRATVTGVDVLEGAQVHVGQELLRVYTIGDSGVVAAATNRLRADEELLLSVRARDGAGAASTISLLSQVARDRQVLSGLKSLPTAVTAPVDGRVADLSARAGEQLTRSDVALHVIDDRTIRVTVPVAARYRNLISVGQLALVSVPGGSGESFAARVVSVGSSTNPTHSVGASPTGGSGEIDADSVPITVELPNPSHTIALGSAVYVRFPQAHRAAVAVNSLAVLGTGQQPFVFVLDHGRVVQRAVVTGVSDGSSTEISSGLKLGDEVVISGGRRLTSGDPVHITREQRS